MINLQTAEKHTSGTVLSVGIDSKAHSIVFQRALGSLTASLNFAVDDHTEQEDISVSQRKSPTEENVVHSLPDDVPAMSKIDEDVYEDRGENGRNVDSTYYAFAEPCLLNVCSRCLN